MKYTESKDGIKRCTLHFPIRFSKQDLEDLKPIAKTRGYTSVTKFLREHVELAVGYWIEGLYEDDDAE